MATRSTETRHIAVETALGTDKVYLEAFTYTEELGRPFRMSLQLGSDDPNIDFDQVIGENVTVRMDLASGESRYFNGNVSRFSQTEWDGTVAQYRATVVPWLWFLTQSQDCRIFQNKKVPDIIKDIFREWGFTDFEDRLSGSYRTWEYCVQYRETDFAFVSRLMEQEGIYYYWKHENGKHTLMITDSPGGHDPYPGYETIPYYPSAAALRKEECIREWNIEKEFQPGKYATKDFDFKNPKKDLLSKQPGALPTKGKAFEVYDFPGEYTETGDGSTYARVRMEEIQSDIEVLTGRASSRGLSAGYTFDLDIPATPTMPREDQKRKYLFTAVTLTARAEELESGRGAARQSFECTFTAIPADTKFRSRRITPAPIVQGPQTAIVVGPSGEEIYTDEFGRVKVMFHWDRYAKADENSSCWIRVSQPWAGKKWGAIFLPRIGQEVIVEFIEGDPDRPIITGRVYNGSAKVPYDLPANATMSTVKSNSSKGGGGWNEIRFEDKKDKEQIFIHAQKNMDERVLNNSKEWVGNDRHLIVKKKKYELVEEDRHVHVKGDHLEKFDADVHRKVDGDENTEIQGTQSLKVTMGDIQVKCAMGKVAVHGMQEVHLKSDVKMVLDAPMITLKATTLHLEGSAMTSIKGGVVLINSGGSAQSGSGASPTAPKVAEDAKPADDDNEGEVDEPAQAPQPPKPETYSTQAVTIKKAAIDASPMVEKCPYADD